MTSFLFWNVMKKDLRVLIAEAVAERNVDILLLAESGSIDGDIQAALLQTTGRQFAAMSLPQDKVRVFTRLETSKWVRRQTDALSARMGIWSVRIGRPPGILLAVVHFVSKSHASDVDQGLLAAELSKEIKRVEDSIGHECSVVVGDLNMNPFEPGLIGAPSLNAVMTRRTADAVSRVIQGTPYLYFYNPMWGLFGDRTPGPPGTYYHRSPQVAEMFWHMLDQVLLRPRLMNSLQRLDIVDRIGTESLLSAGTGLPRHSLLSDHLPLAFVLELA